MVNDNDKPLIVVGDIHGDLNQFMIPLMEYLKNENKYRKLIYLGDYIDRGESNLYVYAIIKFIKSLSYYNDKIIFLKGNHECYDTTVRCFYNGIGNTNKYDNMFITSFVYGLIHEIDFDIVYYDTKLNILFSHSPISRPLAEALAMNITKHDEEENVKNTFTDDKENSKMEYKNIHGHDHTMSNIKTFDNFFNNECKMISIDCDASYGIQLVNNFLVNKTNKKKIVSHVKYLIISGDGKQYKLIEHNIEFYNNEVMNYNLLKFEQLKQELKNTNEYMNKKIIGLKFSDLMNEFNQEFYYQFHTKPTKENIIELIRKNYNKGITSKEGAFVYFNDVPVDIYNSFGLFKDEPNNDTGKLFFDKILNLNNEWYDNYMVGYKRKPSNINFQMKNINENNYIVSSFNSVKLFMSIVCLLTILVIITLYSIRSHMKQMRHKYLINNVHNLPE